MSRFLSLIDDQPVDKYPAMASAGKRTVTYGRHNVLQTISITSLESRNDAYWVMYVSSLAQLTHDTENR